jgi:hypothetical protein
LKFTLANETEGSWSYSTRNKVVHDCDLYVKSATLQMTAQDPNVMIARVFNHLPLALKLLVKDKIFLKYVKKLVGEHLFYDKFEFFGHKNLSRSSQKAKMTCSKSDISMYGEYTRMLVICTYSHSNE